VGACAADRRATGVRCKPPSVLGTPILAVATPSEPDSDVPFDDCSREALRTFRLRDLFPPRVIGEDEDRPDSLLVPLLNALDPEMLAAFARVDCFPTILDPLRAPNRFLDLLLAHLGNPFILEEGLANIEKRRLALSLFGIYALKGTCKGMIAAIRLLFGVEVTYCIQTTVDCWDLGYDKLGTETILCGSTAQERRSFSLMVDRNLSQKQIAQMTNVVVYMKPANTFFIEFVMPNNPRFIDHWALGFSDLGQNTDLHA
jgi:phage tail-like protein